MPCYVVRAEHSSDQCPSANSKVRERVVTGGPEMPKLAQKLGVKFLIGPLVLMAQHVTITVVEAEKIETVEDFVMQSGLMQWNTVQIAAAKPMEEALKELEKAPPAIY